MLASPPRAPTRALVHISGLAHAFTVGGQTRPALAPLDLAIAEGEFVSLIGPSGCGKSTLLRAIAGLLAPSAGAVTVAGQAPRAAQRAGALGVVFQDPALLPWRTVAANVRLPLEVKGGAAGEQAAHVSERLALVGLDAYAHYYPHQLSGGMQQRVALARALVRAPRLLLMDEPFGALDEITRADLRDELLAITAHTRTTVLFVTHSISEAALLSDRIIVLAGRPGRLVADLPVDLPRADRATWEDTPAFTRLTRHVRDLLRAGER